MIKKILCRGDIECPINADKIIANGKNGKEATISAILCNTISTFPPKYPDIPPTIIPIKVEIITAIAPINRDNLAPFNNLLNISLPSSSLPSR